MIGVELVTDRRTKQPAAKQAAALRAYCREHGVLIGVGGQEGNVVRIQPPLTISWEQLDQALAVLAEGLRVVT